MGCAPLSTENRGRYRGRVVIIRLVFEQIRGFGGRYRGRVAGVAVGIGGGLLIRCAALVGIGGGLFS